MYNYINLIIIIFINIIFSQNINIINDSTKTIENYFDLLDKELSKNLNNSIQIANSYQSIGELYLYEEKLDSAKKYFNLSENIFNEHFTESRNNLIKSLKKLSNVYSLSGDFNKLQKISNQIDILNSTNQYIYYDSLSLAWDSTLWIPFSNSDSLSIDSTKWYENNNPSEQSLELMELTLSYTSSGLYSEAINSFSSALSLGSSILDSDYFLDFHIIEDQYIYELVNALKINHMLDTLNSGSHFFLSLCYNQIGEMD